MSECLYTLAKPRVGAFRGMYARAPHLAQLSNEIHLLCANLQISAWFEWVPTECNIADIPIRPQGPEEYEFYDRESLTDEFCDRESLKDG